MKRYYEERGVHKRNCEIDRIVQGCVGVRRTTGQHPGGIVVLPIGEEIYSFTPVQHPAKIRAAAHHFTYRCSHYGLGPDDAALIDWRRQNHRVVTGNDVWLGHNAVLMGGVTLGDGAVVGAGAVVTHDVAPYEIVGGVPARHIGWRYPPELIAAMERIRWWDWSHDMLRERLRDFDDAAAFCRKFDPQ